MCRPCRSAYGKEHYAANRQRYINQARVQKERLRLERTVFLIEFFATHPCVDCGESDPISPDNAHSGVAFEGKRVTRIELVLEPWKGSVQPLHHTRAKQARS